MTMTSAASRSTLFTWAMKIAATRLVEGGTVHVDGGSDGQHEASHALVDLVVRLQAVDRHREGCRTTEI